MWGWYNILFVGFGRALGIWGGLISGRFCGVVGVLRRLADLIGFGLAGRLFCGFGCCYFVVLVSGALRILVGVSWLWWMPVVGIWLDVCVFAWVSPDWLCGRRLLLVADLVGGFGFCLWGWVTVLIVFCDFWVRVWGFELWLGLLAGVLGFTGGFVSWRGDVGDLVSGCGGLFCGLNCCDWFIIVGLC